MSNKKNTIKSAIDVLLSTAKALPLSDVNIAKDLLSFCIKYGTEKQKHEAGEVSQYIHEKYMEKYKSGVSEIYKGREIPRLVEQNTHKTSSGCEGCEQSLEGTVFKGKVPAMAAKTVNKQDDVPEKVQELFDDYNRMRELMAIKRQTEEQKHEISMMFTKYFNKSKGSRSRGTVKDMLTDVLLGTLDGMGYAVSPSGSLVKTRDFKDEEE